MRVFAFGDVHGRPKTLRKLFAKANVQKSDLIVGLGDYFDRGPDTKSVLDFLIEMRETGHDLRCLAGNHDASWIAAFNMYHILPSGMIRLSEDGGFNDIAEWLCSRSKRPSLISYGMSPTEFNLMDQTGFPDLHLDFMASLKPYELLQIGGKTYLFVHAGLPVAALAMSTVQMALDWTLTSCPWEMTWGRTGLECIPTFQDATIVHGHIPWNFVDSIVNGNYGNRLPKFWEFKLPGKNYGKINLDASVGLDRQEYLAGMWFPDEELVLVQGDD